MISKRITEFNLAFIKLSLIAIILFLHKITTSSNVALCRDVKMSSVYDTNRKGYMAVEGTQSSVWDTCASTKSEENPWLLIDLGNSYTLSSIFIFKRDCCPSRLRNLRFELGHAEDDLTQIHQFDGPVSINRTFDISSNHSGRFLRIWMEATDYLTLCEVEVYQESVTGSVINGGLTCWSDWTACSKTCGVGSRTRTRSCTNPSPSNGGTDCFGSTRQTSTCTNDICPGSENIAFGKNVSMSSAYGPGAPPSNAVNGIKSGRWNDGSCASTQSEANPWLIVDLEEVFTVSIIRIVNRVDCCSERLNNVHIELGVLIDEMTEIFYQEDPVEENLIVGFNGSFSGRYVKIWIETNDYLTICELEIYEYIPDPSTTVTVTQPRLGEFCTETIECTIAVSGSVICTSNTCICSVGFTDYKNYACIQESGVMTVRPIQSLWVVYCSILLVNLL